MRLDQGEVAGDVLFKASVLDFENYPCRGLIWLASPVNITKNAKYGLLTAIDILKDFAMDLEAIHFPTASFIPHDISTCAHDETLDFHYGYTESPWDNFDELFRDEIMRQKEIRDEES